MFPDHVIDNDKLKIIDWARKEASRVAQMRFEEGIIKSAQDCQVEVHENLLALVRASLGKGPVPHGFDMPKSMVLPKKDTKSVEIGSTKTAQIIRSMTMEEFKNAVDMVREELDMEVQRTSELAETEPDDDRAAHMKDHVRSLMLASSRSTDIASMEQLFRRQKAETAKLEAEVDTIQTRNRKENVDLDQKELDLRERRAEIVKKEMENAREQQIMVKAGI